MNAISFTSIAQFRITIPIEKTMNRLTSLLVLSTMCFVGMSHSEGASIYDGKWWLSISKEERLGFFEGYATCYINDTDGKVRFTESRYAYEPRLTNYLKANPAEESTSVEQLLPKMATPPYAREVKRMAGEAETYAGKYGYLDGEFWRQSQAADRAGLVEGFLYCYSRHAKAPVGSFSDSASSYVKAISDWYGVRSDDPSEINPVRAGAAIPEVLFKFRDKNKQK